ncbi:uncharacterized protein SRS1_10542 [Sporisorium reilianum f. sp. reilianum]|uniref:Uncharacterized protein n=1 Tax=Sporisorium reilianum f. sp. reilianum TaxID=72559 RepID=A0A2N8U9Q4_9BASI|nr:uncharacterized protein SRS1_10542 [Sporisorium reilianum f. sp. reilianum]
MRDMVANQSAAQPGADDEQQRQQQPPHANSSTRDSAATPSEHHSGMLHPHAPISAWSADPALESSANILPPRYDSHQFPPTPPALHTSDHGASGYFDQQLQASADDQLHPSSAWSPSAQPPRLFASRFPRWGTWLEKRALERHYAQLESQQQHAQHLAIPHAPETPNRKKSWGAWVNDPDAVNDEIPPLASNQTQTTTGTSSLPSLHVNHFGSRFIPHLSAQPLCSILVEIPPPANRLGHDNDPRRQILLVGTAQGLFAIQLRSSRASVPTSTTASSPSSPYHPSHQWNDNVRCIPIWTGLAVYQMCILASQHTAGSSAAHTSQPDKMSSSGVLLALTCPSSAKDSFLASSLVQLSAHANSVLESVAASGTFASSSSSSSHNSHSMPESVEGVAAANFGSTAGGGSGRAVPPGGTGVVRMWHLQAIRELLVYALDRHDAQIPIDLAAPSAFAADKRAGLGAMFRKTFSRQKSRPDVKAAPHRRSTSTDFLSTSVQPLPKPSAAMSTSQSHQSVSTFSSRGIGEGRCEQEPRFRPIRTPSHERKAGSPQSSPPSSKRQVDPAHDAAISLASSSVLIQPPTHVTAASHGNNASFTSLFADDLIQSFSAARQAGAKGKDRDTALQANCKGVLFFSVHEAGKDTKASGTWYLAMTYPRSVLVYEAAMPRSASSRAWSFVKEFYAPFHIKAVAFAPAAVSDEMNPFSNLGPLPAGAGPTKLRVASADGPLLTSKKGSHREQGRASGASSPVNAPRASAAPASWHKADLCLLLSFGRRAVLVRLRDSHVREMELKPLAQLMAAATDPTEIALPPQLSLQPRGASSQTEHPTSHDRSRPLSMVGDGPVPAERQMPSVSAHSRAGSMEQRFRDAILDKKSTKHNWVGFSAIEARIFVRQWSESDEQRHEAPHHVRRHGQEMLGPSPMGVSMVKGLNPSSPASADKALPRVPAPQNASFDRRISRLHLSDQTSQYHEQLQAESSSDSDDDLGIVDTRERAARYQLTDPGPLPPSSSTAGCTNVHSRTPNRSFSLPPAELVSAKMALASRGALTHILPLPLAADLSQAAPLAVMQWSDTPNAVSGWARVLGTERAGSTGTTPLSHLKQQSSTTSVGDMRATNHPNTGASAFDPRRKAERLVLHVGVTCVAFLASRIESRKVTFKIPAEVNFDLLPQSQLELVPLSPDTEYGRANGAASAEGVGTVTGRDFDDEEDAGNAGEARTAAPFAYPSIHTGARQAATRSSNETSATSQELEYLCAPLLTLHSIDLNLHSCGAQSLVLPLRESGHASTAHAMLPELAGDAAVVAFDWRGADDFRIFTVGIAG